ncbi:MAG: ribulose-phosphate 3-epimerase [Rickettsiales bacterium]|nr:ribulose-phosphate 3-epimerase [Rickettsiales bacterium]
MSNIKISPSILSADFANLSQEIKDVCAAGADFLHVDVMDGNFVPNITVGPCVIESVKKHSSVPLDVHLMINNVEKHVEQFIKAGADMITFHLEATNASYRLIQHIKSFGVKVGISIVPSTPAEHLEGLINEVDLVLVMTVEPGFGGQNFIPSQLAKISKIREMITGTKKNIYLAVDGGINKDTIKKVVLQGADFIIAGSYIFGGKKSVEEYHNRMSFLRNL